MLIKCENLDTTAKCESGRKVIARGAFALSLALMLSCGVTVERTVTREVTLYRASPIVARLDSLHRHMSALLYADSCSELVASGKPSLMPYVEGTPHLGYAAGFVLDYLYDCGRNASPIVYARRTTDAPLSTLAELEAQYRYSDTTRCGESPITEFIDEALGIGDKSSAADSTSSDRSDEWSACMKGRRLRYQAFRDSVERDCFAAVTCDSTPEGVFEMVAFRHIYDRFALKWHAQARRQHVVCSPSATRNLVEEVSRWIGRHRADSLSSVADSLDYSVGVVYSGDTVRVSYVWFGPGRGIFRRALAMLSGPPWRTISCCDSGLATSAFAVVF